MTISPQPRPMLYELDIIEAWQTDDEGNKKQINMVRLVLKHENGMDVHFFEPDLALNFVRDMDKIARQAKSGLTVIDTIPPDFFKGNGGK